MKQPDNKVELIKGKGGVFEITCENKLVFSKKSLNRFPTDDEIDSIASM